MGNNNNNNNGNSNEENPLYLQYPELYDTLEEIVSDIMDQDLGLMNDGAGGRKRTNNPREDSFDILYHNAKLILSGENKNSDVLLPLPEDGRELLEEDASTFYDLVEEHRDALTVETLKTMFDSFEDMTDYDTNQVVRNIPQIGGKKKRNTRKTRKNRYRKRRSQRRSKKSA